MAGRPTKPIEGNLACYRGYLPNDADRIFRISSASAFASSAEAAPGRDAHVYSEDRSMRLLISLMVIIYIVGVDVMLSPTVRVTWNATPASSFTTSVADALPNAIAWPVRAFHSIIDRG